jgi:hypothetical protein
MHVAPSATPTPRALAALLERLELRARSVRLYQRLSDGEGVLAGMRALGTRILARLWKARSATQTPAAFERLGEEAAALKVSGAKDHTLRLLAVEMHHLIDDMDPAPTTAEKVLDAIGTAQREESEENVAEAALLCRGDRALTETDLERLIEAKAEKVAADQHAIAQASKLRRQLRSARQRAGTRSFTPHFGAAS